MTISAAQRYALIAQLARDYSEAFGRPAGKKALQKLFYVLQCRLRSTRPYQFSFYNYGVFSHDLARDISDAERYGFVGIDYDRQTNAFSIETTANFEENRRFLPEAYDTKVLRDVLGRSARDLELVTTIMFVCDEEKLIEFEEIIGRVKELKPKFSDAEIRANLRPEFVALHQS